MIFPLFTLSTKHSRRWEIIRIPEILVEQEKKDSDMETEWTRDFKFFINNRGGKGGSSLLNDLDTHLNPFFFSPRVLLGFSSVIPSLLLPVSSSVSFCVAKHYTIQSLFSFSYQNCYSTKLSNLTLHIYQRILPFIYNA